MIKEGQKALAVFLGAMAGGGLRLVFYQFLPASPSFPWATLLVNYLGTFILLYLVRGYLTSKKVSQQLILALGTGFCGGLTTFSGLLLDSLKLADVGRYSDMVLYLILSIAGSFLIALTAGRRVEK